MTSFKILFHDRGSKWYPRILSGTQKPELLEDFNKTFLHWEEKGSDFGILSHLMMDFIMVKLTACFFLLCLYSPKQSHKSCGKRILMFDWHASYSTENRGHWTWLRCLEGPVAWELCQIPKEAKLSISKKTCPNLNKQLSTVFFPMLLLKAAQGVGCSCIHIFSMSIWTKRILFSFIIGRFHIAFLHLFSGLGHVNFCA